MTQRHRRTYCRHDESDAGQLDKFLEEMIEAQRKHLLDLTARIASGVIGEDLFQPPDRQALAANPEFRFEDG
jgi:hypothetical protein